MSDMEDEPQTGELSQAALAAMAKHEATVEVFERRKLEDKVVLPTLDSLVKARLRELEQPVCLFGEIAGDRRDRLRKTLLDLGILDGIPKSAAGLSQYETAPDAEEAFLTEGTSALKACRMYIARRSLLNARRRIERERAIFDSTDLQIQDDRETELILEKSKKFVLVSSQVGDERPVSSCSLSQNRTLLTGSWTGNIRLWSIPDCKRTAEYHGHRERICGVDFHPRSGKDLEDDSVHFASASADSSACLWSLKTNVPIGSLKGHNDRVNRAIFHPFGKHIATASFDCTWRLWDVETRKELLLQEGHSKPVYTVAFQGDGSLIASGGLDCAAMVWDLRSGRSLWSITGHVKPILDIDWSPNGYLFASASEDHSCRIHDVRTRRLLYNLPAHSNLVSGVKWEKSHGAFLVTGSFDSTIRIWDGGEQHSQISSFAAHEGRVMSIDLSNDSEFIVSTGYDRTWKLYRPEESDEKEDIVME